MRACRSSGASRMCSARSTPSSTPSASCAAMVRHHHGTVARHAGDARLEAAAAQIGPRVHELTEFLLDVDGTPLPGGSFPHAVALHPTCHSTRLLGIGDRPRRLLESVPGLRLVELPGADQCCGFGGTFAVKNDDDLGRRWALDKVAAIEASGAEVLTAADTSCLMHIGGVPVPAPGRARRVMHLAEILQRRSRRDRAARRSRLRPLASLGRRRSPRPPGRRSPTSSCARTSGGPPRRSGPSAPGPSPSATTGRRCALAGAAIKDEALARLPELLEALEAQRLRRGRHRPLGARRRGGERRSSCGSCGRPAPTRWSRSSRMATQEIELNEALAAAGHRRLGDRPRRAHRPARPRPPEPHPRARHSPQPRRDPGDLRARDGARRPPGARRPRGRPGRAGRGRPPPPAREVPARQGRRLRGQLRRRRHRHRRRGRVGGQRPDVPDAARDPDHGHGDREGPPARGATWRSSCSCCRARPPASG